MVGGAQQVQESLFLQIRERALLHNFKFQACHIDLSRQSFQTRAG
jgi:hypothetical protein